MTPNAQNFIVALMAQIYGDTETALAKMENVEPVQEKDAIEIVEYLMDMHGAPKFIDLLVNSAIVGMTDNRDATIDNREAKLTRGIVDLLAQNRAAN